MTACKLTACTTQHGHTFIMRQKVAGLKLRGKWIIMDAIMRMETLAYIIRGLRTMLKDIAKIWSGKCIIKPMFFLLLPLSAPPATPGVEVSLTLQVDHYPNNIRCHWTIRLPPGEQQPTETPITTETSETGPRTPSTEPPSTDIPSSEPVEIIIEEEPDEDEEDYKAEKDTDPEKKGDPDKKTDNSPKHRRGPVKDDSDTDSDHPEKGNHNHDPEKPQLPPSKEETPLKKKRTSDNYPNEGPRRTPPRGQ
ncbi:E4 protein [Bos taurus papillomavirus 16]|uniref:E4 protein n=1 Tax=Bos taurus papillomavirus 16 TaxID=1887214 RepID=A0A1B2K204_9PAPI|nr:E4 protein [Bos taurus papillomavirus 16]ANZ90237.1 E4 protein [Bos taurus papillomavirus 16]